mmetsp:Transcript_72414/g.172586  ORF Transcript_72414/g.172586 Transcript_72414/m.172586 type:complete len:405 (+) Transcript_72414:53-1267(+)
MMQPAWGGPPAPSGWSTNHGPPSSSQWTTVGWGGKSPEHPLGWGNCNHQRAAPSSFGPPSTGWGKGGGAAGTITLDINIKPCGPGGAALPPSSCNQMMQPTSGQNGCRPSWGGGPPSMANFQQTAYNGSGGSGKGAAPYNMQAGRPPFEPQSGARGGPCCNAPSPDWRNLPPAWGGGPVSCSNGQQTNMPPPPAWGSMPPAWGGCSESHACAYQNLPPAWGSSSNEAPGQASRGMCVGVPGSQPPATGGAGPPPPTWTTEAASCGPAEHPTAGPPSSRGTDDGAGADEKRRLSAAPLLREDGAAQAALGRRRVTINSPEAAEQAAKADDDEDDEEQIAAKARRRSRWGSMTQHMQDGKNVVDLTSRRQSRFQMMWQNEDEDEDDDDELNDPSSFATTTGAASAN